MHLRSTRNLVQHKLRCVATGHTCDGTSEKKITVGEKQVSQKWAPENPDVAHALIISTGTDPGNTLIGSLKSSNPAAKSCRAVVEMEKKSHGLRLSVQCQKVHHEKVSDTRV